MSEKSINSIDSDEDLAYNDVVSTSEDSIKEEAIVVLKERFYDRLLAVIESTKSTQEKSSSIIISLLKMNKNNRIKTLEAAATIPPISQEVLIYLTDQKYIRPTFEFSKYVMTAQGIWEIENTLGRVSVGKLLEYIDSGMESKVGKLSDKEKVIVFTLICLRTFSQITPLIRISETQKEKSAEVIKSCADFLQSMGAITSPSDQMFKGGHSSESEELGSKLFRRMDKLPENTRRIYCIGSGKTHSYWLDLYDKKTDSIHMEKLSYLFWKIFGGDLDLIGQEKVVDFCNNILLEYKNYIYEDDVYEEFIFFDAKYIRTLSDALFNIIEFQECWETEELSTSS